MSRNAIIYSPLLLGLNLFKYWWSLTHSLPRHGRFWYLKEILIKSQYSAQQSHPKSDVKIKNISNSMISPGNKWQKSDSMSSRHDKNHIKDSFESLRTWGIHKPQYFFYYNQRFDQHVVKIQVFSFNFEPSIADIFIYDIWFRMTLLSTVFTFDQSFC